MVMGQGTRHRLAEDRSAGTSYGALGEAEGGERCAREAAEDGNGDESDQASAREHVGRGRAGLEGMP